MYLCTWTLVYEFKQDAKVFDIALEVRRAKQRKVKRSEIIIPGYRAETWPILPLIPFGRSEGPAYHVRADLRARSKHQLTLSVAAVELTGQEGRHLIHPSCGLV